MINDNMKKMIMPLYNNLILRPYAENPYIEKKTKSGLLINDDQFKSQDSGEEEKLNELIRCAEVIEVGPGTVLQGLFKKAGSELKLSSAEV